MLFVVIFLVGGGVLAAAGAAFAGGFGVPRWLLAFLKKRRENKFLHNFPDAVDVIVRGVKAGLPLGDCLRIIANESPEPVKGEFRTIVEAQTVGISMGDACAKLYERMPLPEANFFGIVVSIQQRAGGNLSEALGNLSRVLRDRKKMKAKIQAMSMEAKASAVIIAALPFAVMILVYISSPNYIELLWTHPTGRLMMACCAAWMSMRRLRDEEDDQFRLLAHDPESGIRFSDKIMRELRTRAVLELLIDKLHDPKIMASVFAAIAAMATVITLAMPLLARNDLNKRMKRGLDRAREDQAARARAARARRQGAAAPVAEAIHEAHRRPVQPDEMGRTGRGAREADPGRLSRPGAVRDLPVLPHGLAGRRLRGVAVLPVLRSRDGQAGDGEARHGAGRRLRRHAAAVHFSEEQDRQAPAFDPPRIPGCARPAADLRRIRHVDRSRVPQGVPGNRLAIDPARRGTDADHRRAVVFAGPQGGLRKPLAAAPTWRA